MMDIREMNRTVIEKFRAGAEVEVHGMTRDRLLLLTTTGRRSGEPHTTPAMFHRRDGRLFVVAAAAGAPKHPAWFLNLLAAPEAVVEIGDESFGAECRVLEGEDRAAVWADLLATYSFFADYERRAAPREIPVVEIVR